MPFAINSIINSVLYTLLMSTSDMYAMIAILFAQGFINSIRINVGYVYMIELMPKRHEVTIGTVWNCVEGLIYLQATIYFYYISKDWFNFVMVGYCFQLISAVAVWWLPESPIFLLNTGRYKEMKDSLKTIAEWNEAVDKYDWKSIKEWTSRPVV
jgi:hypothetical protein